MVVLITCKNEEDPIENVDDSARADNSVMGGGIWPKFELIQAFMYILVTCKKKDDSIKSKCARVVTTFFPIISPWGFFKTLKSS